MYKDPMPDYKPQEYHTEPQPAVILKAPQKDYSILTKIPELPESSSRDNISIYAQNQNNSFSFEKDKLQNLGVSSFSHQTDVNDENVQKLRSEILQKCKSAIENYERYGTVLRLIAVGLLSLDIMEIMGAFFLLLIFAMQFMPTGLIMLWTGSAMVLCLVELFVCITAINSSQNKSLQEIQKLICYCKICILIFVLACTLMVMIIGEIINDGSENIDVPRRRKLLVFKGIIMVLTFLKIIAQISFLWFSYYLKKQLDAMSGSENTLNINSTPCELN